MAADGEPASTVVRLTVTSADGDADAKAVVCAIADSPLVKTAFYGDDPNWTAWRRRWRASNGPLRALTMVLTMTHMSGTLSVRRIAPGRVPAPGKALLAIAALISLSRRSTASQAATVLPLPAIKSINALPTMTPSARPATSPACRGVEMPKPTASGTRVRARRRASRPWKLWPEAAAGARDTGDGDAVDERRGARGDHVKARLGGGGRGHGNHGHAALGRRGGQVEALVGRQVRDHEGLHAGRCRGGEEAFG